ncbi:hypothetical protein AFK68_17755 [Hydrocoleum sp. CS-953]|nr:hypothetical protein AFK68_17755 [Hydrocoleum sp. CS-953]
MVFLTGFPGNSYQEWGSEGTVGTVGLTPHPSLDGKSVFINAAWVSSRPCTLHPHTPHTP